MERTVKVTLGLLLLLWARSARADAVPPPPKDCPQGTHGVTGHAGPGCVPDRCPKGASGTMCQGGPCCVARQCGGDAGPSCDAKSTCESVRLCVQPRTTIGWAASQHPVKEALATCDQSGACPGGGTCETLMVCVAPPATAAPLATPEAPSRGKPSGGCQLEAAGSEDLDAAAGMALMVGMLAARRRQRASAGPCRGDSRSPRGALPEGGRLFAPPRRR
jgi:hypothetical protein